MFEDEEEAAERQQAMPHSKRIGREVAMQYLFRCEMRHESPDAATFGPFFDEIKEEHDLKENRLGRKTREYAEKLYLLVALHNDEIDAAIRDRTQHWELDRISHVDHNIMRIAVAEMLYMEDVPPVVSIDEAVEIARDYSGVEAGNFINGVLNGIKDTLKRDPRAVGKESKEGGRTEE